nr:protein phosphatase CheZ [Paraburkholderia lycopersici]
MIDPHTAGPGNGSVDVASERILARIAQLTRTLHDSLRELGLDKNVEQVAAAVPDARKRLECVVEMTGQAADRVLTAIEIAMPMQEQLRLDASSLDARWTRWYAAPLGEKDVEALMDDTRALLQRIPVVTGAASEQLLEITLAQDFQDLTGQMIRKIMEIMRVIEQQLVNVLQENIPAARRAQFAAIAAPLAANADVPDRQTGVQGGDDAGDAAEDQAMLDEFLESLGF